MKNNNPDTPVSQKIHNWFKNNFKLTAYDVAIFGLLIALYMIFHSIQKFVLTGPRNISITYALFVVYGIILGPVKSAILSILCDTTSQLIYGIQFWMPEYAIVPVLISITSALIFKLRKLDSKWLWIVGIIMLIMITITFISVISIYGNSIKQRETSLKGKNIPFNIVLGISITSLTSIWIVVIVICLLHSLHSSQKIKKITQNLFVILLNITITIVLYRWFWGPFAYINYHNRFRSGTWKYEDYYLIFMIPIIFKSLIEIPIYTFFIFNLQPAIKFLEKKYKHENIQRQF
ncbi:ECF transporter S component [Mycoplasma zalophi]|uniref:ECF transporter S component n=1 Tax=Mycoplasma zalophi TaxID=191287 RepID=UPI001FEF688A|nr:ECF transporter S component [Mycoplasma zalophi]